MLHYEHLIFIFFVYTKFVILMAALKLASETNSAFLSYKFIISNIPSVILHSYLILNMSLDIFGFVLFKSQIPH